MMSLQLVSKETNPMLDDLIAMLTFMRPAGCKAERRFIRDYIRPLGVTTDERGNLYKRIGDNPSVLWSAHTDTVHKAGGRQRVRIDGKGVIRLDTGEAGGCLGADNTAGVWLLREMILAGKPGLYVFHRAEECGGLGSRWIADNTPELLAGIECAIAFDRRGDSDVLTHQGSRCCSDAFADSLCAELNLGHAPDPTGVFTDTANYTELVRECTNVSVGFDRAHSNKETLDTEYLFRLRDAVLKMNPDRLIIERNCDDPDDYAWAGRYGGKAWDWNDNADYRSNTRVSHSPVSATLDRMVREYPEATAELLSDYGITEDELAEYIYDKTGFVRYY